MTNTNRTVLLLGATGLVGRECLALLLGDSAVGRVVTITRRPIPETSTKLVSHVIDMDRMSDSPLPNIDQVICVLGTTIKQAGSQEQFRHVDFDYPVAVAMLGLERGATHFLLVSALGADPSSRVFYNRVKGDLEKAVLRLPYRSITIVRPSLLLGDRRERRLGEEIAKRFGFLMPRKYSPVEARAVAAALVQAADEDTIGHRIIESAEIPSIARTASRFGKDGTDAAAVKTTPRTPTRP